MIDRILKNIEDQKMTVSGWMFGFIGILFVRFIFESLSSPTSSGVIPSDPYTLVHYGLFFLSITLSSICVIGYFIKNYLGAAKIVLFGLPIIWLAPIFDIILSFGSGYKMMYIFDTGNQLLFDFFTFFGPHPTFGATYGMRIGIALVLIGSGSLLWLKTKNITRSILGTILLYTVGFIMGSLPGIMYTFSHISLSSGTLMEVLNYLETLISQSTIAHNTLHDGTAFVSESRFFELGFDKLLSQILFIISVFFGSILLWKIDSTKFIAILKNSRPERINFYLSSLLCGMGFAYINNLGNPFVWIDLFGVICLLISWTSLWMYAVHTNDIYDVKIDEISNTNRPLVKKEVGSEDMKQTGYIWLTVALLGSWSAGFYPFFMSLVYVATSYIYSSPPLRLRRFPFVSSFLISVACLSTILSGFFFISTYKQVQTFPILIAIGIIVTVTLAINFKDVKDVEGDSAEGILTLPILFGKSGIKIVGICFALSILLVPIFLSFYFLYVIALPCAFIGYRLVTKKPYREKPIFVLRFIFLGSIGIMYLGAYWLVSIYNKI